MLLFKRILASVWLIHEWVGRILEWIAGGRFLKRIRGGASWLLKRVAGGGSVKRVGRCWRFCRGRLVSERVARAALKRVATGGHLGFLCGAIASGRGPRFLTRLVGRLPAVALEEREPRVDDTTSRGLACVTLR